MSVKFSEQTRLPTSWMGSAGNGECSLSIYTNGIFITHQNPSLKKKQKKTTTPDGFFRFLQKDYIKKVIRPFYPVVL